MRIQHGMILFKKNVIQFNQKLFMFNMLNVILFQSQFRKKTIPFFFSNICFRSIPIDTDHNLQIDDFDDNTTSIPDFHVILSIDQQKTIETTTIRTPDYHLLFNEHYRKIISSL